jgi:hypothetical protein
LQGGWNNNTFSAQDPALYPTILDGRWLQPVVVITSPTTTRITPTIDGMIVTRGLGQQIGCPSSFGVDQCGGGIASLIADPIIVNNVITNNIGANGWDGNGGGMLIYSTTAATLISSNLIISNVANIGGPGYGGGLYVYRSDARIINNQILSNTGSTVDVAQGGGLLYGRGGAIIQGNRIEFNVGSVISDAYGGGASLFTSEATLISNTIMHNRAGSTSVDDGSQGGGLSVYGSKSDVTLTGNTIAYNTSGSDGGGIYMSGGTATLANNQIFSNSTQAAGGGIYWTGFYADVNGNIVAYNQSSIEASGIFLNAGSANIDGNYIHDNVATSYGGAIRVIKTSEPVTITNNVIVQNASAGIVGVSYVDLRIINNTIADNTSGGGDASGIGLQPNGTDPFSVTIRNNIIINNANSGIAANSGATQLIIDYNDVRGNHPNYYGSASAGLHDINANPQFVNASAGDYHLVFGSPAMNAGTNTNAPKFDKDGVKRPQMGKVDMGAYEVVAPYSLYLPLTLKNY